MIGRITNIRAGKSPILGVSVLMATVHEPSGVSYDAYIGPEVAKKYIGAQSVVELGPETDNELVMIQLHRQGKLTAMLLSKRMAERAEKSLHRLGAQKMNLEGMEVTE